MRILQIDTGREMRGGQWQVLHLMRGLAARGTESLLLSPEGSPLLNAAQSVGLAARPLNWRGLWAHSRNYELVHAHDARAHAMALASRRPLLVSRRVAFPIRQSLASRWKYRHAQHFLAVSEYVRCVLMQGGVEAERISVVYDGIVVPERGVAGERVSVVALDSNDPRKGRAILEEAAKLADIPVHFSRDLTRDLAKAALFVYITDLEGLGSAALLAMAHGAPVVASSVGGLAEIVLDGETGLLTANDPKSVARAMRRLLDDRPFALRMAARARSRVERQFSADKMVDETLRVYQRLLA